MTTRPLLLTRRNATFQLWQALLTNRTKRHQTGSFVVQGVRPITLALQHGWEFEQLIYPAGRDLSAWAATTLDRSGAQRVEMDPDLLAELGEKADAPPELLAVVRARPDDLDRIEIGPGFLGVVFDRPASPGNVGTLIRSADAFGADGVIVTGHAADPYDPKAVRASTGSLFALPVLRAGSADEVLTWVAAARAGHSALAIIGTDETGELDVDGYDWRRPTLLVVGNETTGMSRAWREAADTVVRIPMSGAANSLNAAAAGTVALYEAARQRRR